MLTPNEQTLHKAIGMIRQEGWPDNEPLSDHARNVMRLLRFADLVLLRGPEPIIAREVRLIIRKLREQGYSLNGFEFPREEA